DIPPPPVGRLASMPTIAPASQIPESEHGVRGRGRRRLAETGLSICSWALAGNAGRQMSALGVRNGGADNAPGDRFESARPGGVDVVAALWLSSTGWRRPQDRHGNRN